MNEWVHGELQSYQTEPKQRTKGNVMKMARGLQLSRTRNKWEILHYSEIAVESIARRMKPWNSLAWKPIMKNRRAKEAMKKAEIDQNHTHFSSVSVALHEDGVTSNRYSRVKGEEKWMIRKSDCNELWNDWQGMELIGERWKEDESTWTLAYWTG